MLIRQATAADAAQIVPLFNLILEEMELHALQKLSRATLNRAIQKAFASETYRTSKAQTLVAEVDERVAGFAFGYPDENEEAVNQKLLAIFPQVGFPAGTVLFEDDECFKNEWYLDSIAVSPSFQGKGIGTQLLKALPQIARQNNKKCLGLNVDWANPNAAALYKRHGFQKVGTTILSQHHYDHLQKEV